MNPNYQINNKICLKYFYFWNLTAKDTETIVILLQKQL